MNNETKAVDVLHAGRVVQRKSGTLTTTLCGRMNKRSRDGMNIASDESGVSCKFCLRALARIGGAK